MKRKYPKSSAGQTPPGFSDAGGRVHMRTMSAGDMLSRMGKWRDSLNPLRGLTPQSVTRMVEDAQRGAQSDFQWLLKWVEEEDAVYGAIVERSLSALSALDWDVLIPEHLEGAAKAMAESQQQALKEYYTSLRGLRASIEALGMARFRGCAFLEKCVVNGVPCLAEVPQEYFVRDGRSGPWAYSANAASGAVTGVALDPEHWVVREFARPVGRKAARLYVIKNLSIRDWQGFAEVFGIPGIFLLMPEGITPEDRDKFQSIAQQIVSEARGALPAGSDIKTVEAKNSGNSPFKELTDWCDKQLAIAGTGGHLTMMAESGSGTLAGSAHQEAFDLLAQREAVLVSEIFQEQVDRPFLAYHFPGQPVLAYWQLSAAEETDPAKVVEHAKALHDAGYEMALAQLKEKTGYDLTPISAKPPELPPAPPEPDKLPKPEPEPKPGPEPEPQPDPKPEPPPLKNRLPGGPGQSPADPVQEARRTIAAALNEDFEGIRTRLESLADLDPASPGYAAGLLEAQRLIDLLAGAEPGSLRSDDAFADMSAAALLEGWSLPEGPPAEPSPSDPAPPVNIPTPDSRPLLNTTPQTSFNMADPAGWFDTLVTGEFYNRQEKPGAEPRHYLQVITPESLSALVAQWHAEGRPELLIDSDHLSYDSGHDTKAMGWLRGLRVQDGRLQAQARWSTEGQAALTNGTYRKCSASIHTLDLPGQPEDAGKSPVSLRRARPWRLDSIALTNRPNIPGMRLLTNRAAGTAPEISPTTPTTDPENKNNMTTQALAALLGFPATATEAEISAGITTLKNRADTAASAMADADLRHFAAVIPDAAKNLYRGNLLSNRESTVAVLQTLLDAHNAAHPAPVVTPAAPVTPPGHGAPMHNRAAAPVQTMPPGLTAAPDDRQDRHRRQLAAVTLVLNRGGSGMTRAAAFDVAAAEDPQLFQG